MTDINKKILIVEDSKNYLWILSQTLVGAGFTVATATNGAEGLEAVKKENPDLILSDITMPDMDGITMSKKIKELDAKVPIIFLTNLSDVKNISDALQTATDYIVKSDVNVDSIVAMVKEKLNLK